MSDQEIAALTLVVCAAIYLLRRLFRRPSNADASANAIVSSRLARGLRAAERRRDDQDARP